MDENTTVKTTNTITKPSKHVVQSEINGFPVTSTVYGKAEMLTGLIQKLVSIGATPPTPATQASTRPVSASEAEPSGPPICSIHNAPMKKSAKRGWFCSKKAKNGDGYCDQTA